MSLIKKKPKYIKQESKMLFKKSYTNLHIYKQQASLLNSSGVLKCHGVFTKWFKMKSTAVDSLVHITASSGAGI